MLRGLAARPEQRWPSMDALLAELHRFVAPGRRRGWWLVLVVSVAALGVGVGRYAQVEPRCEGAWAQLEGIWDDGRRGQVQAAIVGTELGYARGTWERVEARLDAYGQAWARGYTEACEATSVRAEQSPEVMDLRMGCLGERRVAMREAVDVLAQADAARVQTAVTLVARLPGVARCADVEALRAGLPPSDDPEIAARVQGLREQLAEIRVRDEGGVYDEAMPRVEAVMEQAEALEYGPLVAEALLERGLRHQQRGQYAQAEQDLERAYVLAAQQGHGPVERLAVGQLVFVVGVRQERPERALQWSTTALALARSRQAEPLDEARVLKDIGTVLGQQGQYEDALAHQRQGLVIQQAQLGEDHPDVASTLNSIGGVLRTRGQLSEALVHHERALAIDKAALGPGHPYVAIVLGNIGHVFAAQGRREDALARHRQALEIQRAALDPLHPDIANSFNSIGAVLQALGRFEEALEHHERALAIQQVALDPGQPVLAVTLSNIGEALAELGDPSRALEVDRRALAILEGALGPRHAWVATVLDNIGGVLRELGELEQALEHHERARSTKEQVLGPRHPSVAVSLDNIGLVLRMQGRLDDAGDRYERSRSIREQELGPDHVAVADSLHGLAEVALARGQEATARALAEQALAIVEAGEVPPKRLASARLLLARSLWLDPSQRAGARRLAEQAREGLLARPGASSELRVEVERWLDEHRLR
ncbi:MAG: tetratricopeptide repeat protein [Myxococcota bacterium]